MAVRPGKEIISMLASRPNQFPTLMCRNLRLGQSAARHIGAVDGGLVALRKAGLG
jgi:hypothetical protein